MVHAKHLILQKLRNFYQNDHGNVAVIFGVMIIPLIAAIGTSVDYKMALTDRTILRHAADSAALTAAAATNLTEDERIELAAATFSSNFKSNRLRSTPVPEIEIDGDTVTVTAENKVETAFLKILHRDYIDVSLSSTAVTREPTPVCLLALNRTMEKAVDIQGGATLNAMDCAVHSNSKHDVSMNASGSSHANADTFCSVGGDKGDNYNPMPKRCGYIDDPYADIMEWPYVSSCDHHNMRVKKQGGPKTLSSGVYCGGLEFLAGADVKLNPGLYIIKDGALEFGSQSVVNGEGVTFYFTGNNTRLLITASAEVELEAPTYGGYEGFIFIQHPDSNPGQLTGKSNEIQGGGSITLVGNIYLPTQPITISGGGDFGINSPLMPVVADSIKITGNGVKTVQIDTDATGMELDLPYTNEGSMLVH